MQLNLRDQRGFTLANVKLLIASGNPSISSEFCVKEDGTLFIQETEQDEDRDEVVLRIGPVHGENRLGELAAQDGNWVLSVYSTIRTNWPYAIEVAISEQEVEQEPRPEPEILSGGVTCLPTSQPTNLDGLERNEAVAEVVTWFFANFEDPANTTPYESAEGGYQYIWGGPYEAIEELAHAFEDKVEFGWIEQAVEEIHSSGTFDWAPHDDRIAPESDQDEIQDSYLDVLRRLDDLDTKLSEVVRLQFGNIGHNNPPSKVEPDTPLTRQELLEIRSVAALLRAQKPSSIPTIDVRKRLGLFHEKARKIVDWLLEKADLVSTEAAKSFGRTTGTVAAVGLTAQSFGVWNSLMDMLFFAAQAIGDWLNLIAI